MTAKKPGKKKINDAILQPGDIVLTTSTEFESGKVRKHTKSDISHAMICVQSHSVIDSTGEGVQSRNTQRLFYDHGSAVYILRSKRALTDTELAAIVTHARSKIGTQYVPLRELSRTKILRGKAKASRKQFCSRLVAQAYAAAGIPLVAAPEFCTPEELKNSELLIRISPATLDVSEDEVAKWDRLPDPNEVMRTATNIVLDGMRKKSSSIQDLSDLFQHVIDHPEDDAYALNLFVESGYLDVWKIEVERNGWHYDVNAMNAIQGKDEDIKDYCLDTVRDEKSGPNRYAINLAESTRIAKATGLKTFEALRQLYDTLNSNHRTRVLTAMLWLQSKGVPPP